VHVNFIAVVGMTGIPPQESCRSQLQQGKALINCGGLWQHLPRGLPTLAALRVYSGARSAAASVRFTTLKCNRSDQSIGARSVGLEPVGSGIRRQHVQHSPLNRKGTFVKATMVIALLVSSLAAAQVARAETDAGIGVSIQSDDSTIYVPIDFNKKFRLEPSLRYLKDEQDIGGGFQVQQESLELGIGLFGLGGIGEQLRFYYGGRLAYIRSELDTIDVFGFDSFRQRSDVDGFRISPTLGFEYLINDRFSIGAEAEYFFQDLDTDAGFGGDHDRHSSGTDTRLIARFKF
jgi:hypothetical protein